MRKSRRWLLASMGASVVAAGCNSASSKGPSGAKTALPLPTPTDCETAYHKTVKALDAWFTEPTDIKTKKDYLGEAILYGFGYNYPTNPPPSTPPLPGNFHALLKQKLLDAYEEGIDGGEIGTQWKMSVAQAFILGQLTYYFWLKAATSPNNPNPNKNDLKFRHLASAWAVFGRATSSCWCVEWVIGAPTPPSRNAYVLPELPSGPSIKQLDEPCALCA